MNPRISEIHGAWNDIINGGLIKLELTIVIDVPPARSRARGRRKGSSFRKIAELATRRDIPVRNYSRPGSSSLSAITNEPPVIENNRCIRVMLPEDRALARARGSASIYELVKSASTSPTRERQPAGACAVDLAPFLCKPFE